MHKFITKIDKKYLIAGGILAGLYLLSKWRKPMKKNEKKEEEKTERMLLIAEIEDWCNNSKKPQPDGSAARPKWVKKAEKFCGIDFRRNEDKRLVIIICPIAGKGTSKKLYYDVLKPVLAEMNFTHLEEIVTEYPKHATEVLMKMNLDGVYGIVAFGGDGTQGEVLRGLYHRDDDASLNIPLAPIPTGSGNMVAGNNDDWKFSDFRTGTPRDVISISLRIAAGKTSLMDLIEVEYDEGGVKKNTICLVACFWAFWTKIIDDADRLRPFKLGMLRYFVAMFWNFGRARTYPFEVKYLPKGHSEDNSWEKWSQIQNWEAFSTQSFLHIGVATNHPTGEGYSDCLQSRSFYLHGYPHTSKNTKWAFFKQMMATMKDPTDLTGYDHVETDTIFVISLAKLEEERWKTGMSVDGEISIHSKEVKLRISPQQATLFK